MKSRVTQSVSATGRRRPRWWLAGCFCALWLAGFQPAQAETALALEKIEAAQIKAEIAAGGADVAHAYLSMAVLQMKGGPLLAGDVRQPFVNRVGAYFETAEGRALVAQDRLNSFKPDKAPGEGCLAATYSIFDELISGKRPKLSPARLGVQKDCAAVSSCGAARMAQGEAFLTSLTDRLELVGRDRASVFELYAVCLDADRARARSRANLDRSRANLDRERLVTMLVEYSLKQVGDAAVISNMIRADLDRLFARKKDASLRPILIAFANGKTTLSRDDLLYIQAWSKTPDDTAP